MLLWKVENEAVPWLDLTVFREFLYYTKMYYSWR